MKTKLWVIALMATAMMSPGLPVQADSVLNVLAEAKTCPYEDQTAGYGGQRGSCTFNCPAPAGTFTGTIDADDRSATVSVTASCGSHDTHCSDTDTCTTNPVGYSGQHVGNCKGDSDEWTDNGIYINCWANVEDDPAGPQPECVIIILGICIEHPGRAPQALIDYLGEFCQPNGCKDGLAGVAHRATAMIMILGDLVVAIVCDAASYADVGACEFALPEVWMDETGYHWMI